MRARIAAAIADTFVVKYERPAVTGRTCRIKTVVLMHRHVIATRQFTSPIVVAANAVRVCCIERLDQILAHQVSAIVGAAEPLQLTILQDDRLKLRKNRLTQPARRGSVRNIANRNGGSCAESDDDKSDADSMSSHEGALQRSWSIKTFRASVPAKKAYLPERHRRLRDARYG